MSSWLQSGFVTVQIYWEEMVDFLATQGAEPLISSPEAFLKILEADIVTWAKVVKNAGVTLDRAKLEKLALQSAEIRP